MRSAVLAVALLSAALVAPSASVAATCSKTAEATTIDLAKLSPVDEGCTVRMEEDGSAVLEIPFYKLPPAPGRRDFLARFDLAGPFDFSECEGLEFDLSCGDISAFTVKQLLMASDGSSGEASGDADWDSYYTFNMKPGEAAATGWRHVTIRKSEAKSYFGHPAGFGTVKRLRFFFMLWHGFPSPVTCRIRNLRMLPPEDMSTDAWVVAGDVSPDEIKAWKQDGFTVIMREANPTIRGAQLAEKAGADILVATGCDEGGCMPGLSTGTTAITALLADAVSIPVLAAGGIVNEKMAKAAQIVGAQGVFVGTRFILSKECRAADATKQDIMDTHPDDYIVFTQSNGYAKWRTTPHKYGREGLEANKNGDMNPPAGSFYYGMLKGDPDAGVNTVSNLSGLIKSIDSCDAIVKELGAPFVE